MLNWIESRTGFVSMAKDFLTEDIPGGASYWYVFGSATLFAMTIQIVTGIFLTFFYAPSAATAWESTAAIYRNPFTHFLLSTHYWGASAMIALVFLHMLQVLIWGAYKSPRELQWIVGVLLFVVTLVLGLTGYLLPWDMNAYFASQVSLNITGLGPVAGPILQNIAQGGSVMGTNTINRFFGLHVWLMPAALVALVGAHLAIFRHNGPAGPVTENPRALKIGRFYPDQVFMDSFISFLVFLVIVALALIAPPFLDAKADPTNTQFTPYPAWYFLSLFGLLNLVPPEIKLFGFTLSLELVATIVVPTLGLIVVMLLPWLDRSTTRRFGSRAGILWSTFAVIVAIVGLSLYSQLSIMQKQAASGAAVESEAQILAKADAAIAPSSKEDSGDSEAASRTRGMSIYTQSCQGCHGAIGQGQPGVIPPLANNPFVTGDPKKVIPVVLNGLHGAIRVNGTSYNGTMPPWKDSLSKRDIADVITYIRSALGNNKASVVRETDIVGEK